MRGRRSENPERSLGVLGKEGSAAVSPVLYILPYRLHTHSLIIVANKPEDRMLKLINLYLILNLKKTRGGHPPPLSTS